MGVELEHLGKLRESITSLEKAKKISELHLNEPDSEMVLIIQRNISDVCKKLD